MTVKLTGAEFKAYMNSEDKKWWPEESYIDDEEITIDEVPYEWEFDHNEISDIAIVKLSGGVYYEGATEKGTAEAHLKRWLKDQKTITLVIQFDKLIEQNVMDYLGKCHPAIKVLK